MRQSVGSVEYSIETGTWYSVASSKSPSLRQCSVAPRSNLPIIVGSIPSWVSQKWISDSGVRDPFTNQGEDRVRHTHLKIFNNLHIFRRDDQAKVAKTRHSPPFEPGQTDGNGAGFAGRP